MDKAKTFAIEGDKKGEPTLNLKAPNLRTNSRVKKTVKMMLRESRKVVYN